MITDALATFSKSADLIFETVQQLNKDLAGTGKQVVWSGLSASAYDEIIPQLEDCVIWLSKKRNTVFQAWLYRVDIPEHVMKKIANRSKDHLLLANAILERTFIKIIFRKNYSPQ
jgi:hypothetical protein